MKEIVRNLSSVWILFAGFALALFLIMSGIGYLAVDHDYERFQAEARHVREQYVAGQRRLIKEQVEQAVDFIHYNWENTRERLKDGVRSRTKEACSIAESLYRQNRGRATQQEIRNIIRETLRPVRFHRGRGCYFAAGLNGMGLLFADQPEWEGKSLLDTRDTRGAYIMRGMIELVRNKGEGFYEYGCAQSKTHGADIRKIAYVKYFAPIDGFIGAAECLDGVESDIRKEVLDRLERIHFGKDGYIFVVNTDGLTLVNSAQPEFLGKNMRDLTGIDAVHVFQQELQAARKPGGDFILYDWKKPGTQKIREKLSFVKGFPRWGWMVGAGVYTDDIEPRIAAMNTAAQKEMWKDLTHLAFTLALLLAAALVISFQFSRLLKGQLDVFINFFKEAETGGTPIAMEHIFSPEFRRLAQSANTMLDERQEAERALRENELRLRTILQTSNEGFWLLDNDCLVMHVNPRMCEILGRDRQEVLGRSVFDFVDQENKAIFDHQLDLMRQRGAGSYEIALRRPEGSQVHCRFNTSLFRDGSGSRVGSFAMVTDITDRKRAEELLRAHEERLRTAMEATEQGWFDLNVQTGEISVSAEYLRISGYEPKEFSMNLDSWIDAIHPEDRSAVWEAYQECLNAKSRIVIEYRLKARSGEWKWIRSIGKIVRFDSENRPLKMIGTHTDISRIKQAQSAQRESEEIYRSLVSLSPDAISMADQDGLLTFSSPKAREIFGYSSDDELAGRRLLEFIPPEEQEKAAANISHLLREGTLIDREYTLVKADGSRFFGEISAALIHHPDGKQVRIMFITRDITERKRSEHERQELQEQLNQAQKMESVGRLAGGVAHDFNNMLGVILGHSELALMETEPAQPFYNDLQEIRLAANRSANLVRQLLAFARKQTIDPRVLDLNDAVGSMLKMIHRLIGENIRLSWRPGVGVWSVRMDPTQVDQILANLCVNARDAIAGVGAISIETGNARIDENFCRQHLDAAPGEYVVLSVQDDGCGMDKKTLGKLFEPFFTTKEVGKGTGLGLSTVYGIVRQNSGFIEVESDPGRGTTFRLYLPRTKAPESQPQQDEQRFDPSKGVETILLVEDEKSILDLGKRILERCGYRVLAAGDPEEALKLARNHSGRIDLLITDIIMPTMNGKELAEKLSEFVPPSRNLFMSGYTGEAIMESGVVEEGVNFLPKPFSVKTLTEKVRAVLSG
jgi:two-component system cell cycle sensor histidine kinase/response regulator CckA